MSTGFNDRTKVASARDEADLFVELLCWFMAVLILPVWLGLRGASLLEFVGFGLGAAALLALGSAATGRVHGPLESLETTAGAFLGIAIVGAIPFGTARMIVSLIA